MCPSEGFHGYPEILAQLNGLIVDYDLLLRVCHSHSSFRLASGAFCRLLLECQCSCIHRKARGNCRVDIRACAGPPFASFRLLP